MIYESAPWTRSETRPGTTDGRHVKMTRAAVFYAWVLLKRPARTLATRQRQNTLPRDSGITVAGCQRDHQPLGGDAQAQRFANRAK